MKKKNTNRNQIISEPKYKIATLMKADEFYQHADIISAFFDSQDFVTKTELRKVISDHLEREV